MTTAAEGDPPSSLLLRLLELPDGFFEVEVLRRLAPRALASLAGAGRGLAAAVAATAVMQWAKDEMNLPPRRSTVAYPVVFEGRLFARRSWRAPGGAEVSAQHRVPV